MNLLKTFGTEINRVLDEAMQDDKVLLLGQDIADPFGGCYRITKGLSTKYPGRVLNTPISEAGTVGMAVGLGMQGFKPVVEIMFQNFLLLAADQLYHGKKIHELIQPVNVTIRTVIGKPDYGYTHEGKEVAKIFQDFMEVYINPAPDRYKPIIDRPGLKIILEDSNLYTKRI